MKAAAQTKQTAVRPRRTIQPPAGRRGRAHRPPFWPCRQPRPQISVHVRGARRSARLGRPVAVGETRESGTRLDFLEDPHDAFGDSENAVIAEQLATHVSKRDREVFRLRFCEDLTRREIGERAGCSQMHVSRILRDGIPRLPAAASNT